MRGKPADQRRQVRNERSRLIIDDLRHYLDARNRQVSAKAKLGEAIRRGGDERDATRRPLVPACVSA